MVTKKEKDDPHFKFRLGEILKDKVTGFRGVAMARVEYWTDCYHYGLCPQTLKDGKILDWEWLDETRLVLVKGSKRMVQEPRRPTSGPFPNAPQH